MRDRELQRFEPVLERLAYVEDVRKYLPKLVTDNLVDPRKEAYFLQSLKKRDHSQKVVDRNNQQMQQAQKKGNVRYESASSRPTPQAKSSSQSRPASQ